MVGGFGERLDLTRTGIADPIHHGVLLLFFLLLSCSDFSGFVGLWSCFCREERIGEEEGGRDQVQARLQEVSN